MAKKREPKPGEVWKVDQYDGPHYYVIGADTSWGLSIRSAASWLEHDDRRIFNNNYSNWEYTRDLIRRDAEDKVKLSYAFRSQLAFLRFGAAQIRKQLQAGLARLKKEIDCHD